MLNRNTLIKRMKNRLPNAVFKAVDNEFWMEILYEETLPTMSVYYPKVIRGIRVTGDMAIEVIDSKGRKNKSCKYAIPLVDEDYPYTGISTFHYPRNYIGGGTFASTGAIDAMASKVISAIGMPDVRFTAEFESPNIIELIPPPKHHIDFSVSMYQMKRLEEIKSGYHENFKRLYEADCKIALYYKFYTISEGGMYGGVELKDCVSDFKDYESTRQEILESMDEDYYKDPSRYEEIFNYNPGYV